MGFAKIDHTDLTDPKLAELSDAEFGLYQRIKTWCSMNETDGHFTVAAVSLLCRRRGFSVSLSRLCKVGVVSLSGRGHVIVEYLKHQTSREKIEETRDRTRVRVASLRTENREQRTENKVQRVKGAKAPARPKARTPAAKKWTTVPEAWEPKTVHIMKARELKLDISKQAEKFRNWEFKDGKTDADRAFHRWLDNATEHEEAAQTRRMERAPAPGLSSHRNRQGQDNGYVKPPYHREFGA